MDIEVLRLRVHEDDLNNLGRLWSPKDMPIEELAIRVSSEGVHVSGEYPFIMNVHFETVWKLTALAGVLTTELVRDKALGLSGNLFLLLII